MHEELLTRALLVLAVGSGVPLIAGSAAALVVGLIQAATQVQEQTLPFLVRVAALSAALAAVGPWTLGELTTLMRECVQALVRSGGV